MKHKSGIIQKNLLDIDIKQKTTAPVRNYGKKIFQLHPEAVHYYFVFVNEGKMRGLIDSPASLYNCIASGT